MSSKVTIGDPGFFFQRHPSVKRQRMEPIKEKRVFHWSMKNVVSKVDPKT